MKAVDLKVHISTNIAVQDIQLGAYFTSHPNNITPSSAFLLGCFFVLTIGLVAAIAHEAQRAAPVLLHDILLLSQSVTRT
jgi:hypothetical protein